MPITDTQPSTFAKRDEWLRPNRAHINDHLYVLFAPEFVKARRAV